MCLFVAVTEPVVRGLCRVLQLTLLRYKDGSSRSYIKSTIIALCKQHPDWTMKHFTGVLFDVAQMYSSIVPT